MKYGPLLSPACSGVKEKFALVTPTWGGDIELSQASVRGSLDLSGLTAQGSLKASRQLDETVKTLLPLKFEANVPLSAYGVRGYLVGQLPHWRRLQTYRNGRSDHTIGGALEGRAEFEGSLPLFEAPGLNAKGDLKLTVEKLLECILEGAKITGNLDLLRSGFAEEGAKLNLQNCEVKGSIEMADLARQPIGVRRWPLLCYPEFYLTEVLLKTGADEESPNGIASFLTTSRKPPKKGRTYLPILLNGQSLQLRNLNEGKLSMVNKDGSKVEEEHSPQEPLRFLSLNTDEEVQEYLKLFCAFVWAESGSFSLLTDKKDLPEGINPAPDLTIHCDKRENDGEWVWTLSAFVRYSNYVYRATFRLTMAGAVEMVDDDAKGEYLRADKLSSFSAPYRLPPKTEAATNSNRYRSDFNGWSSFSKKAADIELFQKEAIWWATILYGSPRAEVRLNGASCKKLKDNAARVEVGNQG